MPSRVMIVAEDALHRRPVAQTGRRAVDFHGLVMGSPAMERVAALGERAARSLGPVLIEGEDGVGKEMLGRAIHAAGARRNRPFAAIDCAAAPTGRFEALRAGAGDALARGPNMPGTIAAGRGGTLFLREIGALPAAAQEMLLDILRGRAHQGSGARSSQRNDMRLIASTKRRLVDLVSEGGFREDLFQLLNVLPIWVPPLRERRSDIPELARILLARRGAERGAPASTRISPAAMALLVAYDWPGNIRQLETAILRAAVLCDGDAIEPEHLPRILAGADPDRGKSGRFGPAPPQSGVPQNGVAVARQVDGERGALPDRPAPARYGIARLLDERGELRPFDALEAEVIRFAVDHCRGHMSEVARRLGIGRSTLYRKLKDYGIASGAVAAP